MRGAGAVVILALALGACGPPPAPAYITDVESLAAGPAAKGAREKAPALWKQASDALEAARKAHARGDDAGARSLAIEASILFKTALVVARLEGAKARITAAENRIAEAGTQLKKFTSLRIDSQNRYLALLAFHESQKDAAKASLAAFQKDREKLEKMSEDEKKAWLAVEMKRIDRLLQAARSTIAVAEFLECEKILPSETKEAREAFVRAENALDARWEMLRPLADEAGLRAERLLVHTRALTKPDALKNPASDQQNVERFVKVAEGTGVMVSATPKGILLSFSNPLDGKTGKLGKDTLETLGTFLAATGKSGALAIVLESYRSGGCSGEACLEDSRTIAEQAAGALVSAGMEESDIAHQGWGDAPPPDPGHCLAEPCPGGRLDVIIVNM